MDGTEAESKAKANGKEKGRKIVKIEQVVRDKKDFLVLVWQWNHKMKGNLNVNEDSDSELVKQLPLEDRLRSTRPYCACCVCGSESTKMVSLKVKGGGALQLQRYCDLCFDKKVDVEKMRMKV